MAGHGYFAEREPVAPLRRRSAVFDSIIALRKRLGNDDGRGARNDSHVGRLMMREAL